jgi:peptide/nickel transport system substrate-binding protein
VSEYVAGDHITEVANKSYFRGAPHLDKIIFRIVPNNNTAINQMQTGELNLLGQTSSLSARQFKLLTKVPNITPYNTQGFNWNHVDLVETGFLKERVVRQALAYATPKQQIITSVLLGYGIIDDGDKPPDTQYYNPSTRNSYPYNPAKAKSLLLADGFKMNSKGILQKNGTPSP